MKLFAIVARLVAVLLLTVSISSCGKEGCPGLCSEVRQKLLDMMPDVSEEEVQCHEPPYALAETCEECKQIFADKFDVAMTSDSCDKYF